MSETYRNRKDVGVLGINISIVDEDAGANVTVWPDFALESLFPPGLLDVIRTWCHTRQAQDWALAQQTAEADAVAKAAAPTPGEMRR